MKLSTRSIRHFFPPELSGNTAYWRGLALATVYLLIAITHLFTYEDLAEQWRMSGIVGGETLAIVATIIVPLTFIAALPYLISMKVSDQLYKISRAFVIIAPIVMLIGGLIVYMGGNMGSLPFFGATLVLPIEANVFLIALSALMIWAALITARELHPRL